MNQQRIKELWDEANSRYYQSESDQPLPQFIFAELIVRECAETIRGSMIKHCTGVVLNTDYNLGLSKASTSIKEHFGVEE